MAPATGRRAFFRESHMKPLPPIRLDSFLNHDVAAVEMIFPQAPTYLRGDRFLGRIKNALALRREER